MRLVTLSISPGNPTALLVLLGFSMHIDRCTPFSFLGNPLSRATFSASKEGFGAGGGNNHHRLKISASAISEDKSQQEDRELTPGTVVTERYLYRFSPTESAIQTPYAIEERQYYAVASDKSLEPLGDKAIIFRGAETKDGSEDPSDSGKPGVYTKIGPALYAVEGLTETEDPDGLEDASNYVMALYCMQHPEIIKGRGMEVGSREGIGGILSVIGAGLGIDPYVSSDADSAPSPKDLQKILMTDKNKELLENCIKNLESSSFPELKVKLGLLDWTKDVQEDMKDQCQFIIGCHNARNCLPLARTVAYALKCSPFEGVSDGLRTRASFLHIEPQHHENIERLKSELKNGYRMNTDLKDIVLERVHLSPLIMDSREDSEAQMRDDIEGEVGGYVEYRDVVSSKYIALVAYHNKVYYGLNGRYFFPSEQARVERQEVAKMMQSGRQMKVIPKAAPRLRSPQEIAQEEARLAREKAAEEERLAREKAAEEERIAKAKAAEEAEKARRKKEAVAAEKKQRSILSKRLEIESAEKEKLRLEKEKAEKENMERVHKIYVEWCSVFNKEVEESRFAIFASNFIAMEAYADKTGGHLQLNQWYDCTEEEFNAQQSGAKPASQMQAQVSERQIKEALKSEKANAEAEAKARRKAAEYEAKVKSEEEVRLKQLAQDEEKRRAEYQAKLKADQEANQLRMEHEEEKRKAEIEARMASDELFRQQQIALEEEKKRAAYYAKKKAEEEARQQKIAEIEAQRRAEHEAQMAKQEAKRQAEAQAKRDLEERSKAQQQAEHQARLAEEEAKRQAKAQAKKEEEDRLAAQAEAMRLKREREERLAAEARAVEDEIKAKAELDALRIANARGMMAVEMERFVADAKMKAVIDFKLRRGDFDDNKDDSKDSQQNNEPEWPHQQDFKSNDIQQQDTRKMYEDKAIIENEYKLAVEAEKKAKSEAQAKADEWYRLAEIEAKAKIATQEAHARLEAEKARMKAEEEYRIAAEAEKWAMAQAQAKADEWYRLAQFESHSPKDDGIYRRHPGNSDDFNNYADGKAMVSEESQRFLNEKEINSRNLDNRVHSLRSVEIQETALDAVAGQEESRPYVTEAEVKAKAAKEAGILADRQGMMSVERERLISEAKVNAIVEYRKAQAKEAEDVAKLQDIASSIEQRTMYASILQLDKAEEERESRVRAVYLDWCKNYGKKVNEERYSIFRSNFILMETFAKESGNPVQLNEWYDCTEDEYNARTRRKM